MAAGIFYRNLRARDQLELFLLAAATSLLAVRFYLRATGYPQIGGGGLHIAHMLWGGVLMLAALTLALSFLGARVQRLVALLGGVGFGVFIDELGKFITHDNDYFYRPTIGVIYAVFIVIYLGFNFVSRASGLTSREYQLNALAALEEAILQDMDTTEKARVRALLARADHRDPLTGQLEQLLNKIRTIPPAQSSRASRIITWCNKQYEQFWKLRNSRALVRGLFLLQAFLFVAGVLGTIYLNIDGLLDLFDVGAPVAPATWLVVGQLASVLAAAAYAVYGAFLLPQSRLRAYEQFRRATLVNIFLVQFFIFSRIEFAALPGFAFSLVLLGLIAYAIRQEQRLEALGS
ncbi:MAG TPA: hypothetical protein VLE73_06150 [Candidatus Saccharimonadales bacterium]|nr:hypothetical protein [Candidatus Saccharimonadales bacterium]